MAHCKQLKANWCSGFMNRMVCHELRNSKDMPSAVKATSQTSKAVRVIVHYSGVFIFQQGGY
jgi:hypothetical protein